MGTTIIHQEWADVSIKTHKAIKGLKTQNLRDHMNEAELIKQNYLRGRSLKTRMLLAWIKIKRREKLVVALQKKHG